MIASVTNPLVEVIIYVYSLWKGLTPEVVLDLILHAPQYYEKWWRHLLIEAPLHILIETFLICFIIWLLVWHRTEDPKKSKKSILSEREKKELIETWKPEPLVPSLTPKQQAITDSKLVSGSHRPSKEEKNAANSSNHLKPLLPPKNQIIESVRDEYVTIRGVSKPVLNMSSFDFLGLSRQPSVKQITKEALDKYGCGSCGPRGFYGTIDKHIAFEKSIAQFMGTQEAISYSDSASAISSAIPAFAKKGDLLIVDEACNEPIRTGLNLSRATVQTFKHNDMADLANILQSIAEDDVRLRRDTTQQRRFIVTEGVFRATGDICPLKAILELKEKYCYRIILDETLSFGTLGATGRGVTEHFGVPIGDVEMVLLSMDTSLASVGGVCVGTREIVDHQRLSGAGYCFSAAGPPFLSAAASEALRLMTASPALLSSLQANAAALHKALGSLSLLQLRSKDVTPVLHLILAPHALPEAGTKSSEEQSDFEFAAIMSIANKCVALGTGVSTCKLSLVKASSIPYLRPSLRLCCSATLTAAQIEQAVANLNAASRAALDKLKGAKSDVVSPTNNIVENVFSPIRGLFGAPASPGR